MNAINPIRQAAEERLKGIQGAFLRCDRGNALYVTNVLVRTSEEIKWSAQGFAADYRGKMTFLVPKATWIHDFERWAEAQTISRYFVRSVENAMFSQENEDIILWIKGIKCLERKGDAAEYEKSVRQRAAVCLREKRGGGTLRVCALIVDIMKEQGGCTT